MTTTQQGDIASRRQRGQRIGVWLAAAVLAVTGVLGLVNGFDDLPDAVGASQRGVEYGVLFYGVLGCASLAAVLARRRVARPLIVAWGIAVTVVATWAPLAFDEMSPGLLLGAVSGGLITALIVYGVWLGVRPRLEGEA
jgi:hypothetical protein